MYGFQALRVWSSEKIMSESVIKIENVSIKFGDGNRYGLIGANGCGKSTFMKILGGEL